MNKDFLTKPISLKDIKIPSINIKELKNNKLFFICIFIIVFFIVICIIGANLLSERSEAKKENLALESKYNALKSAPSKEAMQNEMALMLEEITKYEEKVTSIKPLEFIKVLKDFKTSSPIKWDDANAETVLRSGEKGTEDYDVYRVNIKSFTGTMEDIESFLEYVSDYEKIVRVESLKFNRNQATGSLNGQTSLSFYFKKLVE